MNLTPKQIDNTDSENNLEKKIILKTTLNTVIYYPEERNKSKVVLKLT